MNRAKLKSAYLGSLAADALAMPVHWYYDRAALKREYGVVTEFVAPNRMHSGSFMGKIEYRPLNARADIFREQARYLGTPFLHYHPFLKAGENTVNFQLAQELHRLVIENKGYSNHAFLDCYIECMLKPGWHHDTYLESYHKAFFQNYARGFAPIACGIDDKDIGGLAAVPALISAMVEVHPAIAIAEVLSVVRQNVGLTHRNEDVINAASVLAEIILAIGAGSPVREAISEYARDWIPVKEIAAWVSQADTEVVGDRYKAACPIRDSMPSALYLAWKYHDNFAAGISANAMAGGDNCHRGAVVGGILGAANGPIPQKFITC